MKAEVGNYQRHNERLKRELYQAKLAQDLVRNNEVRHRDESTHRLQLMHHDSSSAMTMQKAAKAVNTLQANSISMTSKLNIKAPIFTLVGNIKVFL